MATRAAGAQGTSIGRARPRAHPGRSGGPSADQLRLLQPARLLVAARLRRGRRATAGRDDRARRQPDQDLRARRPGCGPRSEEHTSELQSLMRISYAVFCLKKKKRTIPSATTHTSQTNKIIHVE